MRLVEEPESWGQHWQRAGVSICLADPNKPLQNKDEEAFAIGLNAKNVQWYYEPSIVLPKSEQLVDSKGHMHTEFRPDFIFKKPWVFIDNGHRYVIHGFELKGKKTNKFTRRKKQVLESMGIIIVVIRARRLRIWMKNGGIPIKQIRY